MLSRFIKTTVGGGECVSPYELVEDSSTANSTERCHDRAPFANQAPASLWRPVCLLTSSTYHKFALELQLNPDRYEIEMSNLTGVTATSMISDSRWVPFGFA